MQKIIRRRTEQAWHELITRQEKSGQSVQEFCRVERTERLDLLRLAIATGARGRQAGREAGEEPAEAGGEAWGAVHRSWRAAGERIAMRDPAGSGWRVVLQVVRS